MNPIRYQNRLLEWSQQNSWCEPTPQSVIDSAQQHYYVLFPQAYLEFLSIAGNKFPPLGTMEFEEWIFERDYNNWAKEWLEEEEATLGGEYWVFEMDDNHFSFFYFDDGEDPLVYYCVTVNIGHSDWLQKSKYTLSEYINQHINRYEEEEKRCQLSAIHSARESLRHNLEKAGFYSFIHNVKILCGSVNADGSIKWLCSVLLENGVWICSLEEDPSFEGRFRNEQEILQFIRDRFSLPFRVIR